MPVNAGDGIQLVDGTQIPSFGIIPNPPPQQVGWTDPKPSADTRFVYVSSSSGDDVNNSGLSPRSPLQSILQAKTLLRPGFPDWLLLKRGDTFSSVGLDLWIDQFNHPYSGRSPRERMVVTSYGTGARPLLQTYQESAFIHQASTPLLYLYILGLDFDAHTNSGGSVPPFGIDLRGSHFYVHVEDCLFRHYKAGAYLSAGGTNSNFVFRRNRVQDGISDSLTHTCYGGLINAGTHPLFEQNFVDNIGVDLGVNNNVERAGFASATSVQPRLRGNVISRCGRYGVLMPGGGEMSSNLVLQCPHGVQAGSFGQFAPVGGVPVDVSYNMLMEGVDTVTSGSIFGGVAMNVANTSSGQARGNIITRNSATYGGRYGVILDGFHLDASGTGYAALRNFSWIGNKIYKWGTGDPNQGVFRILGQNVGPSGIVNLLIQDSDFQEPLLTTQHYDLWFQSWSTFNNEMTTDTNRFYRGGDTAWFQVNNGESDFATWVAGLTHESGSSATQVSYAHADRTIGDYHLTLGGSPTTLAFINATRALSRAAWNDGYLAETAYLYFLANFAG